MNDIVFEAIKNKVKFETIEVSPSKYIDGLKFDYLKETNVLSKSHILSNKESTIEEFTSALKLKSDLKGKASFI